MRPLAPAPVLRVGMRVVVREGTWPAPRIAGHYGKVRAIVVKDGEKLYDVDITGHIDGGRPAPIFAAPLMRTMHPDELELVD